MKWFIKIKKFAGIFLVLLSFAQTSFSKESVKNLYSENSFGNVLSLQYFSDRKKIKFIYDKPKVPGRNFRLEFNVNTPNEVRNAVSGLSNFLKDKISIRTHSVNKIISKLKELEFLATGNDEVVHIGVEKIKKGEKFDLRLQSSFHQNRKPANEEDPDFLRSIPLLSILIANSTVEFQFRLVVDENNEFKKFSVINIEEGLRKYNIISNEKSIVVKEKDGSFIFKILLDQLTEFGGKIVLVQKSGLDELENVKRSHFHLSESDGEWRTQKYSESQATTMVVESEVSLSAQNVFHEPVVRIDDTDKFFKTLNNEDVIQVFKNSPYSILNNSRESRYNEYIESFKSHFQECMYEKIKLVEEDEEVTIEEDAKENCRKYAVLQAVYSEITNLNGQYIDSLEKSLEEKRRIRSVLSKNFKQCLAQKELITLENDISEIEFLKLSKIKKIDELFGSIHNCEKESKQKTTKETFKLMKMNTKYAFASQYNREKMNQRLKLVVSDSFSSCQDKTSDKSKGYCKKYVQFVKNATLFQEYYMRNDVSLKIKACFNKVRTDFLENIKFVSSDKNKALKVERRQFACAKMALKASGYVDKIESFNEFVLRIDFIRLIGYRFTDKFKDDLKRDYKECVNSSVEGFQNLKSFLVNNDQKISSCKLKVLKLHLPNIYKVVVNIEASKYTKNNDVILELEKELARMLKSRIINLFSIKEINDLIEEKYSVVMSAIMKKIVYFRLKKLFVKKAEDNSLANIVDTKAFESIEFKLKTILGIKPNESLKKGLLKFFMYGFREKGLRGLEIFGNDFLINFEKIISEFTLKKYLSSHLKNSDLNEEYLEDINAVFISCMEDLAANKLDAPLLSSIRKCKKKRLRLKHLKTSEKKLEYDVTEHFPLTSSQSQNILSPMPFFSGMYR